MLRITWIDPHDPRIQFPPVERALKEPNGLLAAGGDLSPARLELAYRSGIFPWYEEGQPVLWWSPDPRGVIYSRGLHLSRSLRKRLRQHRFEISFDHDFPAVVAACAGPRRETNGTWITHAMHEAYVRLFEAGLGHSVEVWQGSRLVGGLYGIAIGRAFFAESMFSHETDASKVALAYLARHLAAWGYPLIDTQLMNPHLERMGARTLPRAQYVDLIRRLCREPAHPAPWRVDPRLEIAAWYPDAPVRGDDPSLIA